MNFDLFFIIVGILLFAVVLPAVIIYTCVCLPKRIHKRETNREPVRPKSSSKSSRRKSPIDSLNMDGVLGFKIYESQEEVVSRFEGNGVLWNPMEYELKKNSVFPFMLHTRAVIYPEIKTVLFDFDKKKLVGVYFEYNVLPEHIDICFEELSNLLIEKFGQPDVVEDNKMTWSDHIQIVKRHYTKEQTGWVMIKLSDTFNF